ncbi:MAG TPA: hypothetical protein VFE59_34840 [Trebonia sp.]|jgi:hypothetical protein|nr:hypothetical protein [Trebonia sp.]
MYRVETYSPSGPFYETVSSQIFDAPSTAELTPANRGQDVGTPIIHFGPSTGAALFDADIPGYPGAPGRW